MKQLLLLAGLVGTASAARAQVPPPISRTVLTVGSFGLAPNVGIQAERQLNARFSVGLQANRFFGHAYPGYQAALLGRYYLRPTALAGFFVQAQAAGLQHSVLTYGEVRQYRVTRGGFGGGLGLGYQVRAGRHFALSVSAGAKLYHLENLANTWTGAYLDEWRSLGKPGSVLDGQLAAGYAF